MKKLIFIIFLYTISTLLFAQEKTYQNYLDEIKQLKSDLARTEREQEEVINSEEKKLEISYLDEKKLIENKEYSGRLSTSEVEDKKEKKN